MVLKPVGQSQSVINVNGIEEGTFTQSEDSVYSVTVSVDAASVPESDSINNQYGSSTYTIRDFSVPWGTVSSVTINGTVAMQNDNNLDMDYDYTLSFCGNVIVSDSGTVSSNTSYDVYEQSITNITENNPSNTTLVLDSSASEYAAKHHVDVTLDITYTPDSSIIVDSVTKS